jgi:hypothetical protein
MPLNEPTTKKPEQPQRFLPDWQPTEKGMQKEFSAYLEGLNKNWLAHMQSETALAMQFASKLSATRSIPETTTVYQEWANRRMELFTEDSRRFLADTQKLIESGLRALARGWTVGA